MVNTAYLLALHSIDGLGPVRLKLLIEYFQDPRVAWEASEKELLEINLPKNVISKLLETRKKLSPEKYLEDIERSGIKWISVFDEDYPRLLKEIHDPPVVLYYKGEISLLRQAQDQNDKMAIQDDKAIAIVGTRKVTGYGRTVTEKFTTDLSKAGLTIVSGLARGVDTIAHQSTLNARGRTLAVLGGGLNRLFPPENKRLAQEIANGFGAVLSEFPPDYPALPGNFPARNRIISGLSLGVLVTEAASDSGSLITARIALEQGREVFAVPGPITSSLSKGPYELIKEGGKIVMDASEVLEELGVNKFQISNVKFQIPNNLSEQEKQILEILENEGKHIDEICRSLNLSAGAVSGNLLKMEIAGIVRSLGNGTYCKS